MFSRNSYESHVQWKYRGLEFPYLGFMGDINDAGILSTAAGANAATGQGVIGSQNYGWYSEVGYDVLPLLFRDTPQYLAPFVRYEKLNTIAQSTSVLLVTQPKISKFFR